MGRHSVNSAAEPKPARPQSKAVMPIVASATALALVLGGGSLVATSGVFDAFADSAAASACGSRVSLDVVASPSIAQTVAVVVGEFDEQGCTDTTVVPQRPADTASVLASGGKVNAEVWIPDGEVWVDRMYSIASSLGRAAVRVDVDAPIASTPVVFAVPTARVTEFGAGSLTWAGVGGDGVPAVLADPEGSSASLAGMAALSRAAGDDRALNAKLIELGKSIPESTEAAFGAVVGAERPTVAIASEHDVVQFNRGETANQLTAIFPEDGTVSVGYPMVRVGDLTRDPKIAEAVNGLEQALRGAGDLFAEAGFRDGKGGGVVTAPGVEATASPAPSKNDSQTQLALLREWAVLTLRTRMLAVIDVSGSMEEPATDGLRRIDVFQQAAMGAMSKFSGEVEMGVWVFSTDRNGDQDYEDLVPFGPLGDPAQVQQIGGVIASLPQRLGGGTGLYDTTLAAVQRVRGDYQEGMINSVLLITDGKNEDDEASIELDRLLAELSAMAAADPKHPVPVIMIGFGPDTDMAAMQQIAEVTGGAAYSAAQPGDLGTVLVDALSQRTCRPDCE